MKLTTPPSTGSTGLLAVTVTASGLLKNPPTAAVCGVLPATGVRVKPWLSKAPMSTVPLSMRTEPRWSVVTPLTTTPAPMAGLPESLVQRFGVEAANVIAAATCERPAEPVAGGIDVTRAEFEYAITHEGALTVEDIVDRRTRIGLVAGDRERVTGIAAEFLAQFG